MEKNFALIDVESLSCADLFIRDSRGQISNLVRESIDAGLKNFYVPTMAPSFTDDGEGVQFVAGKKHALGKSAEWWNNTAKNYCPERNSHLCTRLEYGAFLGVMIKKRIENVIQDLFWYDLDQDLSVWEQMVESDYWREVHCGWSWLLDCYSDDHFEKVIKWKANTGECHGFDDGLDVVTHPILSEIHDFSSTQTILADDKKTDKFWVTGGGCFAEPVFMRPSTWYQFGYNAVGLIVLN